MQMPWSGQRAAESSVLRERLISELRAVTRNAEELLKGTAGDVNEKAAEIRDRLTAAAERAQEACHDLQAETLRQAKASAKTADTFIRERPYEAVGIAFGLGLIVSVLLVGRRRL